MNTSSNVIRCGILWVVIFTTTVAEGQQREIPDALKPWERWVTWDELHADCPRPFNNADEHLCFWPSKLAISAAQTEGSWTAELEVFEETWVPLPGSQEVWPLDVTANGEPVAVLERQGQPHLKLLAGRYEVAGTFRWDQMPQRIAIPEAIGILSLAVDGQVVPIPDWDAEGDVWLRRVRPQDADEDLLAVQVYRVVEDGIPVWLRTEIELTVSGKSREEELGWILPQGWKLSLVDSPIPVAVDDRGRIKAQVRAGKWTINVHAFHTADVGEIQFAPDAVPLAPSELIGFQARPEFRIAEFEGAAPIDVAQTTFPARWRQLPVFSWETDTPLKLVEKMRGMGLRQPEGLNITRHFWLDEDGGAFTYRDTIQAGMQQIWRLDAAAEQDLGAVRIDGEGQLITANPDTGAAGVEIRNRNLNLEAVGRAPRGRTIAATGWQTDVDGLQLTIALPPGWRVFALFGADRVEGDWLTNWSLLDLFLLLIFALAVSRLWGWKAGFVALLAIALAFHEPGAPRYSWFILLMPLALLRVVELGAARWWISWWKRAALALLVLMLVPFLVSQVQSAIYPQLETPGLSYSTRGMLDDFGGAPAMSGADADYEGAAEGVQVLGGMARSVNLRYDPKAVIQTGPAEPEWGWNQVVCYWNGPVSQDQRITPILISVPVRRGLIVLRIALLLLLAAILLGASRLPRFLVGRAGAAAIMLLVAAWPQASFAQFPQPEMLETLRTRLLEPSDAFPHAADISTVDLSVREGRIKMEVTVHAALKVAVPLPGRLPAWSPVSVEIDDQPSAVVRREEGYLWLTVPGGVHNVVVEGWLPDTADWQWTFLLRPRHVSIDAPDWNVTGVRPGGVPEQQVFFVRKQQLTEGQAAYDQKHFHPVVVVERRLEVGLIWKVENVVSRLSAPGKAVSIRVPLLAGESVLTPGVATRDGRVDVLLGAGETAFAWQSELPVGSDIDLMAEETDQWVERWYLVTSPVWNVALSGLPPVFQANQADLIPAWHPWPGEEAKLHFAKPAAVAGETVTVQRVFHETALGSRRRTMQLRVDVQTSLAGDFVIGIDPNAEISSLKLDGQAISVRRDGTSLIVPTRPGKQSVEVAWRTSELMRTTVAAERVSLPVAGSNVTSALRVPENRWILWADGPLRGPAVRFWIVVVAALLVALALGSVSLSPLSSMEWILLTLGLTQVHLVAAMLVVGWLFLLAWRGRLDPTPVPAWRFDLLQAGVVIITLSALGVLVAVVGEGLLGNPDMFIIGNGSSRTYLQWFQPRTGVALPEPHVVSISVWFYRLLMLCWALWLATALLRWLKRGWSAFTSGGGWKRLAPEQSPDA